MTSKSTPHLPCLITTTTVAAVIKQASVFLNTQTKTDTAKLDAQLLLAFALNKSVSYLLTWPDEILSAKTIAQFQSLLNRRLQGEPIAYVLEEKEFWSLPFKVSPATLIPRPDTELLVEQVLLHFANKKDAIVCLDLGTGTGAIALALASERHNWQIDAVDFSEEAVALAQYNAQQLALTQVTIYQSDWFAGVPSDKQFDVIVSNPPYIDKTDKHLTEGDVRFEPKTALVANKQGLADIEKIAIQARQFLKNNGMLFFEHGYQQAIAVQTLLKSLGYQNIQTITDLSGNDRVTKAVYTQAT